jgi:hypothetical protein
VGILKSAGDSFMKYGELIINKTEDYTRIAKLKIDIKRLETEVDKCHIQAGKLAINEYNNGNKSFAGFKDIAASIDAHNAQIDEKKQEIEELKKKHSQDASQTGE